MKRAMIAPLILVLALTSCSGMGPKETGGTLIGGAGGALIGSQIGGGRGRLVGVAVGTLAGALIGREIGRSLDATDRAAMERNTQYALEHAPTDQATPWRNPDTGHHGSTVPKKTYRTAEGQYCREYQQTVIIGGEEHQAYGTACRQPDGSWQIVK